MNENFILRLHSRRKLQGISDEDLSIRFAASSDNKIIDELFGRYVHLVFALCMKYFKDEEQAKDTTMTIFENLGEKLKKFEIKNFKSWLCTVARNTCLMELRKNKNEIPIEQTELSRMQHMENGEEMHLMDEDINKKENLILYLHQLNDNQRICLDMMYFRKKSYKEIAEKTGLSMSEVKSHIQNGKRNLRNLMKPK